MKRVFDLVVSVFLLGALMPLFLILYILIRVKLGKPVFFKQVRPGLNSKAFVMYKFRSMTSDTDALGHLLPDEQRLTAFGKFLRSSSLDELPGLINVIKGNMSLVGPRPLLMEYLPLYSPEQRRRHDVKPGITGWAQVNGRNAISWQDKFKLDVWYVDHCSFGLDIKILFLTVKKVLMREGINNEGKVTVEYFKGNDK